MQCDTQGHVAEPREPTRAPAWRGGDTCMHIIFIYIVYSYKYKRPDYRNLLTSKFASPYIPDHSLSFSLRGTMFHSCFELQATWLNAMRWIKSAWIIAR